jgi:hypothetical protein
MLRVRELVNSEFPIQHPQAEEPCTRMLFSMQYRESGAHLVKMENGYAIIHGGRVTGVQERNVYAIMTFGSERVDSEKQIATITVTQVNGFKVEAALKFETGHNSIPGKGALTFPQSKGLPQLTAFIRGNPHNIKAIQDRLKESNFFKSCEADREITPQIEFVQEGNEIFLRNSQEMQLVSRSFSNDQILQTETNAIILDAEKFVRAQHLLRLHGGGDGEALDSKMDIEFGLVRDGKRSEIPQDGTALVTALQRAYVLLRQPGQEHRLCIRV